MTYVDQWKALSSRIRGLAQAGRLHAEFLAVRSSDAYGTGRRLHEQAQSILEALQTFRTSFGSSLPTAALSVIDHFVTQNGSLLRVNTSGTASDVQERQWAAVVLLTAFESELSFVLSDVQESIRARAERAFIHLQRSIVVDMTVRDKWLTAFEAGELECEKLGAVHLLLHGIWAFKVDAAGARTDLVFQEPLEAAADAERSADGLVLTEWKKVRTEEEAPQKFEEAQLQARRYAQGALGGIELTSLRYLVIVSRRQLSLPGDFTEGGVVYRHINVPVEPSVPSRA
jgi:hypothetical protein